MPNFVQSDIAYREAIEAPGRELAKAFETASTVKIDLDGTDITEAVLLRLKSFIETQDKIKGQLNKVYAAPAADFFVETIVFFLKSVLLRNDPTLSVASERTVVKKLGSMRPDISVWRGDELVATIECKTQLGWNRKGWLKSFKKRGSRLKKIAPNARMYLLVLSGGNWPGFGEDKRINKQFFVLLNKIWPRDYDISQKDAIGHRLETLINSIIVAAENQPIIPADRLR